MKWRRVHPGWYQTRGPRGSRVSGEVVRGANGRWWWCVSDGCDDPEHRTGRAGYLSEAKAAVADVVAELLGQ